MKLKIFYNNFAGAQSFQRGYKCYNYIIKIVNFIICDILRNYENHVKNLERLQLYHILLIITIIFIILFILFIFLIFLYVCTLILLILFILLYICTLILFIFLYLFIPSEHNSTNQKSLRLILYFSIFHI